MGSLKLCEKHVGGGALWKKSGKRREGELLLVSKIFKKLNKRFFFKSNKHIITGAPFQLNEMSAM